jgi:hypothetical protein
MPIFNDDSKSGMSVKAQLLDKVGPWLTGSGIAAGQAFLATGCSVPKIGKCVGCGSCVVAVVTLTGWALKNRKARNKQMEQGLEPFEVRTDDCKR